MAGLLLRQQAASSMARSTRLLPHHQPHPNTTHPRCAAQTDQAASPQPHNHHYHPQQQQRYGQWQQLEAPVKQQRQRHPGVQAVCSTAVCALLCALHLQVLPPPVQGVELLESSIQSEGNIPSELSAAGEQQAAPLSSLLQGSNKKQIEGCTRRCVPTCIRGGEGSPGLGPISLRREIVVFKDGFRSRQYCLSECAHVCKLISDNEQQQQQQESKP